MIVSSVLCRVASGLLLGMLCAGVAGAQAAEPSYQPGIDVLDYDVHLQLPDTGSTIEGDVTLSFRRSTGVTRLRLDLEHAMSVRLVQVGGRTVPVSRSRGRIDVPLASMRGDSGSVRVVYDGVVRDGLIVRKDARGRWTWFGDNWPDRARHWLPSVDHPSDKATVSFAVVAPTSRTVVANGLSLGSRPLGGARRGLSETRWRESRPIASYLMVIAAGPLAEHRLRNATCSRGDRGECVAQSVYVMPEVLDWMPGPFVSAGPIVELFARLVGPFPYEKLAHLQSATRFGGMENASAIFYADKLFSSRTLSDGLIAHETAHQWFGDAVTQREWGHLWLSEGFATYFAALWTREARGDSAYRAELRAIRTTVLGDPVVAARPVLDTAETDYMKLLNRNSYEKGGFVLYMLHQELGDSAFFSGVQAYYARYRHGTALTDDLQREMERASGRSLSWFFDQWLRRPGVATPTIGWAYDAEAGTLTLAVQQDGAQAPYALPLVVDVTDAGGTTRRHVVRIPAERRSTVVLPERVSSRPRRVAFDPGEQLLMRHSAP